MIIYPELARYSSKNECARTDTVFFPISQVCTRGVTLTENLYGDMGIPIESGITRFPGLVSINLTLSN